MAMAPEFSDLANPGAVSRDGRPACSNVVVSFGPVSYISQRGIWHRIATKSAGRGEKGSPEGRMGPHETILESETAVELSYGDIRPSP